MSGPRTLLHVLALVGAVGGLLLATQALQRPAPPARVKWEIQPGDQRVAAVFSTLKRSGLAAALDSLEHRAAQDSAVLRGAHQLAHALGREALVDGGGDPATLGQCRPIFGSGCYHGVIESLLKLRGRVDMIELQRMCEVAGAGSEPGAGYECAHGVGHGVLGAVGLDLSAALAHCDAFTRPNLVSPCHEGAFMEAISAAVAEHEPHDSHAHGPASSSHEGRLSIDRTNPYSPCDQYAGSYGEACWLFQGFLILRSVGFDAGKALRVCDSAPVRWADRCSQSVGHQLAGLFQRSDAWLVEQCGEGSVERAAKCASGAAIALVLMDWSGARARRYCTEVASAWREPCFAAAADILAQAH